MLRVLRFITPSHTLPLITPRNPLSCSRTPWYVFLISNVLCAYPGPCLRINIVPCSVPSMTWCANACRLGCPHAFRRSVPTSVSSAMKRLMLGPRRPWRILPLATSPCPTLSPSTLLPCLLGRVLWFPHDRHPWQRLPPPLGFSRTLTPQSKHTYVTCTQPFVASPQGTARPLMTCNTSMPSPCPPRAIICGTLLPALFP